MATNMKRHPRGWRRTLANTPDPTHYRQPTPFWRWLRFQYRRNDGVGHLARLVAEDAEWPRSQVYAVYQEYLIERNANLPTLAALQRAWREWKEYKEP